jgi:acetyl esterase/lipase
MEDKKGITLRRFCYGAVILLVSFVGVRVGQNWDSNEGMFLNVILLINPLPPIEPIMNQSTKDQTAFLDDMTQKIEGELPEPLVRLLFGEDFAASSFGSTKTQVAQVFVPSRDEDRNISALCTRPQNVELNAKLPLVLYFHSGGLILGSTNMEIIQIRYIAQVAPAVVCSIDYRKAPSHPYPAAVDDDSLDAALFLIKSQDNLLKEALDVTIDPSKVATFGYSAGGYLAAQTSRLLALEGVSIQIQISLAPMVKPHGSTDSMLLYGKHDFWSRSWNTYAWAAYLPGDDGELANDWTVSLLVDPPGDQIIERLPPVYIQINTGDVLHDEGKMYAQRLAAQHKLLELVEYDTNHIGGGLGFSKGGPAQGSFERAVNVLKQQLYQNNNTTTSGTTGGRQLPLKDSEL